MATTTDTDGYRPMTKATQGSRRRDPRGGTRRVCRGRAPGRGGRATVQRYADRMDGLVRTVVDAAQDRTATPFAVCALGGYGRRTLCLHSDIDLLVVFDGAIAQPEERFVNALLQPLWDLKLELGQHVRELAEFDASDTSNPELLLCLLDLRFLAGDTSLFERVVARIAEAPGPRVVAGAAADADRAASPAVQQHAVPARAGYQAGAGWLAGHRGGPSSSGPRAAGLRRNDRSPARTSGSAKPRSSCCEFDSILHLLGGRDVNQLTHELQEKVADALDTAGTHSHQRVESLMSEYFRRARTVTRAMASAARAVRPAEPPAAPRRVGRQFEINGDGVRFANPERAANQPSLWVDAFRVALDHGGGVSERALSLIEQNLHRCTPDDFVSTEGERQQLRKLLVPRRGLYDRLSEMHDCGLLNRIFPEFAKVHCRVVRDFYHKYTVDEHTLLAIRGLESLLDPPNPGRRRFTSILQEVRAPELLTLALLFHDVGKWREADHAQESVRLAQSMLDRLELPDDERADRRVSDSRASADVAGGIPSATPRIPHVAARFAELVGTEEHLKLLCLMTLADVGAVSPETLTPWKEDLLWRVYVDTYNRLTLGYADQLLDRIPPGLAVLIAGRPADISEPELRQFLDGLPRRYLSTFGLSAVYRHVRLARDIHPDEVHTFLEKHDDVWELTLVTLDKPFLFSNISGVLSYFGMDIHRGQAMTTPNGLVLDVFEFTDDEGFLEQNAGGDDGDFTDARTGGRRLGRRHGAAARAHAQRVPSRPAPPSPATGRPFRQRAFPQVHGARDRRGRRAGAAAPDQPGRSRVRAVTCISC